MPPGPEWTRSVRDEGDVRCIYDAHMRGDEQRIIQAFCDFMSARGWSVSREVDHVDVVAEKDGLKVLAEAKGRTAAIGLDVDTMFGQLLRRMPSTGRSEGMRFAVVVPTAAVSAVRRVPAWVLEELQIDVYVVGDDGSVAAP